MTKDERRELIERLHARLEELGATAILLGTEDEQEDYAAAIVGLTTEPAGEGGTRVVYLRSKVIEELVRMNGWSHEEAEEWYEFNTVRGLGYINILDNPPLMVDDI